MELELHPTSPFLILLNNYIILHVLFHNLLTIQTFCECFLVSDIIECGTPADSCSLPPAGSCVDGGGTFMCMCNDGYTGDGTNCQGK